WSGVLPIPRVLRPYSRGESSQRPWARLSAPSNRPLPNESTPSETNRVRRSGSETITNTSSARKTTSTVYADTSATTPPNGRMIKTTPRTSQSCPNTVVLPDRLTPRPTSVYPLRRRQSVDGFEPRSGPPHFCQTNSRHSPIDQTYFPGHLSHVYPSIVISSVFRDAPPPTPMRDITFRFHFNRVPARISAPCPP